MKKKIKELFVSILQIPENLITQTSNPFSIEAWTSLNHLLLITAFEEKFFITIEPEEIPQMSESYANFESTILKKIKQKG